MRKQRSTMSTTAIEKKSLEAHVELCAERYANLDNKLSNLETRIDKLEDYLVEIRNFVTTKPVAVVADSAGPYKAMIGIGTTIAGAMIGAIITLIIHIK